MLRIWVAFSVQKEKRVSIFSLTVVARQMWKEISQAVGFDIGSSSESIGTCWLSNKCFLLVNMVSAAALWGLWKLRNDFCFQHQAWRSMGVLLLRVMGLLQNWLILCPTSKKEDLKKTPRLSRLGRNPGMLDVLMEREDDNLLNLGSWSWQLKNLDVSLMPEDNLKTRSTWKNPLSVA